MKLPMPYSPLSLSEAHRRRAAMRTSFLSRSGLLSLPERDENDDDVEEQA